MLAESLMTCQIGERQVGILVFSNARRRNSTAGFESGTRRGGRVIGLLAPLTPTAAHSGAHWRTILPIFRPNEAPKNISSAKSTALLFLEQTQIKSNFQ